MPTTDPGITDTHPLRPLFPATAHSITVTTLGLTIVILAFTLLSAPCSSTIRARYPGMALCAFIGGLIWLQSESEWTRHPLHLVPFVSSSTQLSCSPLAQFVFGLPMWLAATIVPLIQFYSRAYLSTHDSSNVWPTMFLLPLLLLPGALLLRFVDITQGTCTTLFLDGGADYSLQHNGHHDNDDGDDETCCLKDGWTVVLAQLCLLYVLLYAWLMMKLWVVREQVSWFKHHVMLGVSGLLVAACHVVVYVYAAVTSSHEVFGTRDVGQTAHEFLMVLDTLLITVIPVWSRFLPIVSSCSCCCEPDHVGYGPRSTATSSGGSYGENVVRGRVPNAVHAEHTTSPAGSGHYDAPPPYTPALAQDRRHRQRQSPAYGAITHVQPGAAHADSCQQERATLDPPPYTPSPNVRRFPRHSRQSIPNFSDPPTEQSSLLTQHQLQQQQQYQQQHHNYHPHGHRPAPAAPSAASANNPSPTAPPVPHHLLRLFQPPEDVRVPGAIQQQHLPPPPPPPSPPPLQSQHASHQQHNGQHPRATSPNMLQLESLDDDVSAVAYGRKYYN